MSWFTLEELIEKYKNHFSGEEIQKIHNELIKKSLQEHKQEGSEGCNKSKQNPDVQRR